MKKKAEFSDRLYECRKKSGLTQVQLSKKLGFKGNTTVYRLETGQSTFSAETLCKISEVLKVDLHWLLTGKASPTVRMIVGKLRPLIKDHVDSITRNTTDLLHESLQLQLGEQFRGEDNKDRIADLEKQIELLRDEYGIIYDLLQLK